MRGDKRTIHLEIMLANQVGIQIPGIDGFSILLSPILSGGQLFSAIPLKLVFKRDVLSL